MIYSDHKDKKNILNKKTTFLGSGYIIFYSLNYSIVSKTLEKRNDLT
jgi:hypothetical protein